MSHAINKGKDFVAVVNGERSEPWHRLGQRVDKAMTAKQAMKLANLDFEVVLQPVFAINPMDEDDALLLPHRYAVVKSGKGHEPEVLGVVGKQYTPVQNSESFDFMDAIVDNMGGAHYDTAGFLRPLKADGTAAAQVFLTIDLGDAGNVFLDPKGANDQLETKLACCTSHDGSLAFTVLLTSVRIVCANTQAIALAGAKNKWVMKHTKFIEGRMKEARDSIGLALKYTEQVGTVGQRLITQQYADREFVKMIQKVFPMAEDPTPRQVTEVNEKWDRLIWLNKSGPNNENIRGTKWCAYQSVTEYLDWYRPVRNAGNNPDLRRATDSAGFGWTQTVKSKTLNLLTAK